MKLPLRGLGHDEVVPWSPACATRLDRFLRRTFGRGNGARGKPDAATLAAVIDRHVEEKLKAYTVPPARQSDDAAFFRRINLVLAGRVPVPSEVRNCAKISYRKS